jgi:hypothetical protein
VLSVLLLLANVLSILLRYTDSDFPFGIFKLFFILNLNGTGKIYILNRSLRLIISFSFCSNLFLLSIQYTQSLRYIDTLITCKTYHSYWNWRLSLNMLKITCTLCPFSGKTFIYL